MPFLLVQWGGPALSPACRKMVLIMNRVFIPSLLTEPTPVPADAVVDSLAGLTMGTSWSVKLIRPAGVALATLRDGIEQQLALVVAQMSTWREDSDLSRYNSAAADSWHALPAPFIEVLDSALAMAEHSDGAYDPTVGPLVNLWGFGPRDEALPALDARPDATRLAQERARCGWRRVRIDRSSNSVLQPGGLYLDFSGIAKGYGVDLVARYLHDAGVPSYLVEVGGELRGHGVKADGQPWWVGLELPPQQSSSAAAAESSVVALHGMALATSGDYRRCFEQDSRQYSHTIDPRSAEPVSHGLASVTVLHADCMRADAWATALMVLGDGAGWQLAQDAGVAALFLRRGDDGGLYESMTPAMQAMLT